MRSRTRVSISLFLIVGCAVIAVGARSKRSASMLTQPTTNRTQAAAEKEKPKEMLPAQIASPSRVSDLDQKISATSTRIKELEKNMEDERIKEQLNDPHLSDYLRDLYFQKIDELVQLDQQLYKLQLQKIANAEASPQ